ncbi:hypothetical protein RDI58_004049 [Solanum bulbocastanum]|uniref:Uncharacterized protein n=1 Tax=Solanum bulbocastanum TaxID=147425 RepID=A0AAN8YPK1_SOLBU
MPDFYGRLEANRCICFANEPIKSNYIVDQEFYAKAAETDFSGDLVFMVWGKQVLFDSSRINNYNGLPDGDNEVHTARENKVGNE